MTAVILDKSFLQGASGDCIRALAETHRLVVSDALFYELLTAPEPGRSRCFAKFLPTENPVDLVSHIGELMRFEMDNRVCCGKPSAHREALRFKFNPALMAPDYILPAAGLQAVEEETARLRADVESFLERASMVPTFFPDLLKGSTTQQKSAQAEAEQALAAPGSLMAFYSSLEPPAGEKPLPPAHLVSEDWAVYRYLQVQMLFALDVYVRYQGKLPQPLSGAVYERMEHDVLDAEVLMLGCLEGAFGTRERKLQGWWRLLCPHGRLYA
ncbi:MAG TPA: hypothetical protein VFL54_08480 [Gammaproteobacteria bacterium]|nr:hypothetical protein [Gammaproteobacteria bacterium]